MCLNPRIIRNKSPYSLSSLADRFFVPVRCNHCVECHQLRSSEVAFRTNIEATNCVAKGGSLALVTLTYDDEHLPYLELERYSLPSQQHRFNIPIDPLVSRDDNQGFHYERFRIGTWNKVHLTNFFKTVRNRIIAWCNKHHIELPTSETTDSLSIRGRVVKKSRTLDFLKHYYACERGGTDFYYRKSDGKRCQKTFRPHYHIILICYALIPKYTLAQIVADSWPYGHADNRMIGRGFNSTVNYVAKYVCKQNDDLLYKVFDPANYSSDPKFSRLRILGHPQLKAYQDDYNDWDQHHHTKLRFDFCTSSSMVPRSHGSMFFGYFWEKHFSSDVWKDPDFKVVYTDSNGKHQEMSIPSYFRRHNTYKSFKCRSKVHNYESRPLYCLPGPNNKVTAQGYLHPSRTQIIPDYSSSLYRVNSLGRSYRVNNYFKLKEDLIHDLAELRDHTDNFSNFVFPHYVSSLILGKSDLSILPLQENIEFYKNLASDLLRNQNELSVAFANYYRYRGVNPDSLTIDQRYDLIEHDSPPRPGSSFIDPINSPYVQSYNHYASCYDLFRYLDAFKTLKKREALLYRRIGYHAKLQSLLHMDKTKDMFKFPTYESE